MVLHGKRVLDEQLRMRADSFDLIYEQPELFAAHLPPMRAGSGVDPLVFHSYEHITMTFSGTTTCGFTRRCLPAYLAIVAAVVLFGGSSVSAQTANKATLRSWNITGATGSTANVLSVTTDTTGSNVWI